MKKPSALILRGLATAFLLLYPAVAGQSQGILSALPQAAKAPPDNPFSSEKAALGKLLFWDPILSAANELIEFLGALNDQSFDKTIPTNIPSGPTAGGRIQ